MMLILRHAIKDSLRLTSRWIPGHWLVGMLNATHTAARPPKIFRVMFVVLHI